MTDVLDLTDEMYRGIRAEIVLTDTYDPFEWVQSWRFAICDVLLHDWGYLAPGFRTVATEPEDTYEVEILRTFYAFEDEGQSIPREYWGVEDALKTMLTVLDRYRVWVGIAGEDY